MACGLNSGRENPPNQGIDLTDLVKSSLVIDEVEAWYELDRLSKARSGDSSIGAASSRSIGL